MKIYLLSDGHTTADVVKYVVDYLKLYLTIHSGDVPINNWGNEMNLLASTKEDILGEIRNAMESAITELNEQVTVHVSLKSCDFDKTNNIKLSLEIDDITWELYLNQI